MIKPFFFKKTTWAALACVWAACLSLGSGLFSQNNISHRVILLGNLADVPDKNPFIRQLEAVIGGTEVPFTLILNGDLVKTAIGEYDHQDQIEPILRLADMMEKFPQGNMLLVPGDRDWNSSKRGGEKSLRYLETRVKAYLEEKGYQRSEWAVSNGCPGPKVFDRGKSLAIVALNTQWWNHPFDKPRPTDALCDGLSEENLKEEIEAAIEANTGRNVLIVGHHPFHSVGNYGGQFSLADHFTPLPLIGLFKTSFHTNVGSPLDLANEHLQPFVKTMKNLFFFHESLIYASAHERNQQILKGSGNLVVNSGAPVKGKFAGKDGQTVFSEKTPGIFQLDYYPDGQVDAVFLQNQDGRFQQTSSHTLFSSACTEEAKPGILRNTAFTPCMPGARTTPQMQFEYAVKSTLPASDAYSAGPMKRFLFGKHYRTSWAQPVAVPFLDLDTTHNGLVILKKGGGRQTTSLKFASGDGPQYTFRSVDKDPTKALNYILKNTIAAPVVQDFTSTQHPYGALVVAPLLGKIDILHASPILYRLPDDAKLGPFRKKYGNLFGMLEENPGYPDPNGKVFGGADAIEQSVEMFNRFYKNQRTHLQTDEFLRARLFDIWIGDWSKHEDNWKWARYKTPEGPMYRPVPRDRDHAFSRQDGLINWLADRRFGMQNIEDFGHDFRDIRSLTYQARNMDRFLLQEAGRQAFLDQARLIQELISEKDIEAAVSAMPPEVLPLSGNELQGKLKNRLQHLEKAAAEYYRLLNREVDVTGSQEKEFFEITYLQNGAVQVRMFDMEKGKDGTFQKGQTQLYDRTFLPRETKEVRVWALANDDVFEINGPGNGRKIKVRVFGGPGEDLFKSTAPAKTIFYDKGVGTKYDTGPKAKIAKHWNKELYEYDRLRFNYDYFLPLPAIGYSRFAGFGANLSANWTHRSFTKDDYHSKHKVFVGYTTRQNFSAGYLGRFHQTFQKWDLLAQAFIAQPQLQNRFYGAGNNSRNLTDILGKNYYQAAVSTVHGSLGLARDFWKKSTFELWAGYEQHETDLLNNTYLSEFASAFLGTTETWAMIPYRMKLDLDLRDKKGLPYHGARALFSIESNHVVAGPPNQYWFQVMRGDLEYYLSTHNKRPVTVGLRAGGAFTNGDIPWFKLPTLGFDNGLRGYVEDRFAGTSVAYFNTEIRYQAIEAKTAIVPVKVGLKAFYDHGRVFAGLQGESRDWRSGYGFGLYLVPLTETLTLSLTIGFSDEETAYPMFSLGAPLR